MNFIPQLNVPSIVTGDFNIDLSKSGSESKLTKFMHYYGFVNLSLSQHIDLDHF